LAPLSVGEEIIALEAILKREKKKYATLPGMPMRPLQNVHGFKFNAMKRRF
jgi:hypothetical protein